MVTITTLSERPAFCRGFPDSSAQPPESLPGSDLAQPDQGDPFLQRLIGPGSQQDKFIKERLEEMSDDATDVRLVAKTIQTVSVSDTSSSSTSHLLVL